MRNNSLSKSTTLYMHIEHKKCKKNSIVHTYSIITSVESQQSTWWVYCCCCKNKEQKVKIELQFSQQQHQYHHHFHIPHPMLMLDLKEIYMDLQFVHVDEHGLVKLIMIMVIVLHLLFELMLKQDLFHLESNMLLLLYKAELIDLHSIRLQLTLNLFKNKVDHLLFYS